MKILSTALIAAAVALSLPGAASAQTLTFTGASSATDGTDGNIRTYTLGTIQVQASAWSYQGSTLEQAFLGQYSTGLGITNNDEGNGSSNNSHTIDNLGQTDFVLLFFNQAVNISSARLTPYDISATANDNDAWVGNATMAHPFTVSPTALTLGSPLWASLLGSDYTVQGNMVSPYATALNSAGLFGNFWLIGAASPNTDARDDGFKLTSINVTAAVPEPATWAMMLIGFGAIGFSTRRRRIAFGLPQAA